MPTAERTGAECGGAVQEKGKRCQQTKPIVDTRPIVSHTQYSNVAPYDTPLIAVMTIANDQQALSEERKGEKVYRQWVKLHGPRGEVVRVRAVVDGGAMRNTMCTRKWSQWGHRLGEKEQSTITMRVADNHHIPSAGRWKGKTEVSGVEVNTTFEMFDSHGAFEVILGKPWLRAVKAVHHFEDDSIDISTANNKATIQN
ncbi:hypothetical protein M422DRAFT_188198, partial [Sphaerobolus stellatus SS14]